MKDGPASGEDRREKLTRTLYRRRALARLVLSFERLWPALWPALGIAGLFVCLALLELPQMLPPWPHALLLTAVVAAIVGLLIVNLRGLSAPRDADADRRLEQASGLSHRPLAVLSDRPVLPGAEGLWHVHVARAAAQVRKLRIGLPRPGLAARDRRALRGGLVVALLACLVIAGEDAPLRLARAMQPHFVPPAPPPASQLQAWITPPGYTRLAPILLKSETPAVTVPAGSHLTVNLTGGTGEPALLLDGKAIHVQALDAASFQAEQDLTSGGRLSVRRLGREIAGWDLTVVVDAAPVVTWPEPPGEAPNGGSVPRTRLPWQVSHEYGVVALQAELHLKDRPDAPALIVPIPLPGAEPRSAHGVRLQDLTANPWAGLPVSAKLVARDAAGLSGSSAEASFDLPERVFQNPVAQMLMAVRKALTLKPDDRLPPVQELDRISGLPGVWDRDPPAFLNLRAVASLLFRNRDPAAVDEAQTRIWQLALHLEEGAPERTARALEEARQAVREMMDAQKRGEKIDQKELQRRIEALREALRQHLQALDQQLQRETPDAARDPNARELDAQEMQRLAEQMQKDANQGNMDKAEQELAELEQMLDQLRDATRPEHGKMDRQRAQKRQRGQQQMSALQDIVRRQGGLLDRAQSRAEQERADQNRTEQNEQQRNPLPFPGPNAQNQPDGSSGDNQANSDDKSQERTTDRRIQQALRRALGELMQQYGDLTGQVPPNLGDADTAMHDAQQALGQGQDEAAAGAARKAIEALQKGGRSMSQQLARQFGRSGEQQGDEGDDDASDGQGEGDPRGGMQRGDGHGNGRPWQGDGSTRHGDRRLDPLGRPLKEGTSGANESSDVTVPDQMEEARTRVIQEELRRRGSERTRPQPELDYIERLLKQF
jgi:uncharacterized protein (TIGR02302 family)